MPNGPALASITLREDGGGIAAVSRLVQQVLRDEWGADSLNIELLDGTDPSSVVQLSTAERARFCGRTAAAQIFGRCSSLLFCHVSLVKAQALVPRWCRRPYAVFLYGIEAWKPLPRLERRMLAQADLRIAISRFTAQRVSDNNPGLGPIAECALALPCASHHATMLSPHDRRGTPALPVVITVGRMSTLERYKGHDQLLDVWPAVLQSVPDARLVFAGDGDDRPRLQSKAAAKGLQGHVQFTGFVQQDALRQLYRNAAVFAMPSRGEGFGLVYLEAMAHGLPCIGSVHDAAGEVIQDGVTGFLVDQQEGSTLVASIVRLLTDDRMRLQFGAEGYRRLQQQFTYDSFKRRLLPLLETSLRARATGSGVVSADERVA